MTDILNTYYDAFSVFFGGMPDDIITLVCVGLALATQLLFFSFPFLIVGGEL